MIRAGILTLAIATLNSCLPTAEPEVLAPVGVAAEDAARMQCEARGGRFAPGGASGAMTCFTTPPDAGKSCQSAQYCSTHCLARSGTCAPVSPLFGCNEILTRLGARVTLCID